MTGPWELKLGIWKLVCLLFFNFFVSLMFSWLVMPVNEYIQNKPNKAKQNKIREILIIWPLPLQKDWLCSLESEIKGPRKGCDWLFLGRWPTSGPINCDFYLRGPGRVIEGCGTSHSFLGEAEEGAVSGGKHCVAERAKVYNTWISDFKHVLIVITENFRIKFKVLQT